MIKLFRNIRKKLLSEGKTGKYMKYALGEIVLVVVGILIALQINNWNEHRKERLQEVAILKSLQSDLETDRQRINYQLSMKRKMISDYSHCLDILSGKKKGTKAEFMEGFQSILQVGGVSLNQPTFNNLQTTGEIRIIQNKALSDSIIAYYNTNFRGWETALRDYARNTSAPFLLQFDYLPRTYLTNDTGEYISMPGEPSDFPRAEKTLDDYRNNYFIINTLRQKVFNLNGLMDEYNNLLERSQILNSSIQTYLNEME